MWIRITPKFENSVRIILFSEIQNSPLLQRVTVLSVLIASLCGFRINHPEFCKLSNQLSLILFRGVAGGAGYSLVLSNKMHANQLKYPLMWELEIAMVPTARFS